MITKEQKQELKELAKQVGFKVTARGSAITLENKCQTFISTNDTPGYDALKIKLADLGAKSAPVQEPKHDWHETDDASFYFKNQGYA